MDWKLSTPQANRKRTIHELWDLNADREAYRSEYLRHWKEADVDLVICPAHTQTAARHGTSRYWGYTSVCECAENGSMGPGSADAPRLPQLTWSITQRWRSRRACLSIRASMRLRALSSLSAKPTRRSMIFVGFSLLQGVVIALADPCSANFRRPSTLPQLAHLPAGCSCQVRGREASSIHGACVAAPASVARLYLGLHRCDCGKSKPRLRSERSGGGERICPTLFGCALATKYLGYDQ